MGWKRVGTCDDLEQKGLNCLEGMSDETERERERNAKKMIARVEAEKKNQPLGVKAKRKKKIKEKG